MIHLDSKSFLEKPMALIEKQEQKKTDLTMEPRQGKSLRVCSHNRNPQIELVSSRKLPSSIGYATQSSSDTMGGAFQESGSQNSKTKKQKVPSNNNKNEFPEELKIPLSAIQDRTSEEEDTIAKLPQKSAQREAGGGRGKGFKQQPV